MFMEVSCPGSEIVGFGDRDDFVLRSVFFGYTFRRCLGECLRAFKRYLDIFFCS